MRFRFLILFVATFFTAYTQTYSFKQYTEENGLTQSYIYCISQSNKGLLTLSTGETLNLFDGNKFTTLSDSQMTEDIITTHLIDSRNITWLSHQQNGLSYIKDGRYNRFGNKIISGLKISQIIEDDQKNIWLATTGGIFRIDADFKISQVDTLKGKNIFSICFDAKNNLIVGTDEGLSILSVGSNKEVRLIGHIKELKDKNIKQIIYADTSKLKFWILVDGEGIYGLIYNNGKYRISTHILNELKSNNFNVTCLYSDQSQNLWVSVFGDGLRKLSFIGDPMMGKIIVTRIDKSNGLKSDNIQSIFQDSEGNMWFGTFGDGLIKKPVEMFSFYSTKEGLKITDIKKVVVDTAGNFWMGTKNGLSFLKKEDNSFLLYNSTNGFVDDRVNALLLASNGVLWIGTNENGIYTFDTKTRTFQNFSKKRKLNHKSINTIIETENKIMIGCTDGLYSCDKFSDWSEELTTSDGLLHNNILHLFEDSKKRIWVSSHSSPPYYISAKKITAFKKIKGLNSFKINCTCEDKNGNIWIATDEDGVFKFDNKEFHNYTVEHGLLSNYCNGIETDRNNSVWVTHGNGLSELKEFYKKFTTYSEQRGLLFCENNFNAVYKDSNSDLWFGTSEGIVQYNPEAEKSGVKTPEVFITKIILNTSTYYPEDYIEKKYGYYSVHIYFGAISLSEPDVIYYKYRLLDVDTNWIITAMPYVDFPKLGDGEYKFEVIAYNANNGLSSKIPAIVSFEIKKPVWKYAWFYFLLIFLICFVIYIIISLRTRALVKTQILLKNTIEEKTFLLKKEKEAIEIIKEELELKNKDITASINYAKRIQDSLLPPEELMEELFHENYFVMYKPKDIVSGDFYWCTGHEMENLVSLHLAAVIDCTGHGVPGAFLSILANDFLKQSVIEKNVNTPSDILNFLNENISSHLNQTSTKDKLHDGMDIALIGIDYNNLKLYYSGANNPIYIYRQINNFIEEIIVKPTKQPIGSINEIVEDYELQIIDLLKGDMIYLFSDGYADQFGGESHKKLTYKRFREILFAASSLSISDQKYFVESKLIEWKGKEEQTDDICVMGIKI